MIVKGDSFRSMDSLEAAHAIVVAAFVICALAMSAILIDSLLRSHSRPEAAPFVRALDLTNLTLVPTGRPLRNPDILNPAVDLRFSPLLSRSAPDSAELLLKMPDRLADKGGP